MLGHAAICFVLFPVDLCGSMGRATLKSVSDLGDAVSVSGRIPKAAFMRCAMQSLCVAEGKFRIWPQVRVGDLLGADFQVRPRVGCPSSAKLGSAELVDELPLRLCDSASVARC